MDNPVDPGGATKCGISLRFLAALPPSRLSQYGIKLPVTVFTIKNLTDAQIHLIYLCEFWQAQSFVCLLNQRIANYIFDMCVQFGVAQGIKTAQRAYNLISYDKQLMADGVLGNISLKAINAVYEQQMIVALTLARIQLIEMIVERKPPDREFLQGWLARANRI